MVAVATTMANEIGIMNMTLHSLCDRLNIKKGSFSHRLGCGFNDLIDEIKPNCTGDFDVQRGRVKGDLRKEQILSVAVRLSKDVGYTKITRQHIADDIGISISAITTYFTMTQLRKQIMRRAVHGGVVEIIGQGLANKDKHAEKASEDLKKKAVELLIS